MQHTKEQQESQQLQAKLTQELHDKEAAIKELQLELNAAKAISHHPLSSKTYCLNCSLQ